MMVGLLGLTGAQARTQAIPLPLSTPQNDLLTEAREALKTRDRKRLQAAAQQAHAAQHPLAAWVAYWDYGLRLGELSQADLEDFYARFPGTYVEDRLRNDWLLELGRRRDWANFQRELPRFKMADDREVVCYGLLAEHAQGREVRERARAAWLAQKDGDEGCAALASALFEARKLGAADIWTKLRLSVEYARPRAIRQATDLLPKPVQQGIQDALENNARFMARKAAGLGRSQAELATLGLIKLAGNDPAQAADGLQQRWAQGLPPELAAWAWAQVAKQAAFRLQPEAADYAEQALKLQGRSPARDWSEDSWAWMARAALRADQGRGRPALFNAAYEALQAFEAKEPVWAYWRARLQLSQAPAGAAGEAQRQQARAALQAIANPLHFYGQLAAEDLGLKLPLPPAPAPLTPHEKGIAFAHGGLNRALALISLGLRNEGVREWNFSLRGMGDRELLAAAQLACDREVWDRCINSSERTRGEIDLSQRFPLPLLKELSAKAAEAGLDLPYVYGLIRQESRFIQDARSHVGASGLMQVMPATAKWTARKLGLDYRPEFLTDRDFNLRVGTGYLKLVLDDFGGAMPLAAAAYNAGPNRPRRWREGQVLDASLWTENVPFNETRDYVKKVLANATVYARLMGAPHASLRERLGVTIGPRETSAPLSNQDLP
ncbi:transglycosylase SLT domain-containing protein [Roseateles sp. DB2]|uniref:lytic transglycosylase domain-containing protein n=1 Tax=Roseateles sp. DB2 TaxID=3453717 RepID=UPI003EED66A3